jgi:hypothetical protein
MPPEQLEANVPSRKSDVFNKRFMDVPLVGEDLKAESENGFSLRERETAGWTLALSEQAVPNGCCRCQCSAVAAGSENARAVTAGTNR